jgi:hypothetical protein
MQPIRRILLPPVAAALLGLAAAGTALGGSPSGTVSVFNADGTPAGATVCDFYVVFNPVTGGEHGAWKLRNSSQGVVEQGDYHITATESDREPDTGSFSVPNGTYKLLWDNEPTVDSSHSEITVVVACEAGGTETPFQTLADFTDVPTSVPTSRPTGGGGPLITLPNTAAMNDASPDTGAWLGAVALITGLAGFVVVLAPRRRRQRR